MIYFYCEMLLGMQYMMRDYIHRLRPKIGVLLPLDMPSPARTRNAKAKLAVLQAQQDAQQDALDQKHQVHLISLDVERHMCMAFALLVEGLQMVRSLAGCGSWDCTAAHIARWWFG
jgi:hypothetical protein